MWYSYDFPMVLQWFSKSFPMVFHGFGGLSLHPLAVEDNDFHHIFTYIYIYIYISIYKYDYRHGVYTYIYSRLSKCNISCIAYT